MFDIVCEEASGLVSSSLTGSLATTILCDVLDAAAVVAAAAGDECLVIVVVVVGGGVGLAVLRRDLVSIVVVVAAAVANDKLARSRPLVRTPLVGVVIVVSVLVVLLVPPPPPPPPRLRPDRNLDSLIPTISILIYSASSSFPTIKYF